MQICQEHPEGSDLQWRWLGVEGKSPCCAAVGRISTDSLECDIGAKPGNCCCEEPTVPPVAQSSGAGGMQQVPAGAEPAVMLGHIESVVSVGASGAVSAEQPACGAAMDLETQFDSEQGAGATEGVPAVGEMPWPETLADESVPQLSEPRIEEHLSEVCVEPGQSLGGSMSQAMSLLRAGCGPQAVETVPVGSPSGSQSARSSATEASLGAACCPPNSCASYDHSGGEVVAQLQCPTAKDLRTLSALSNVSGSQSVAAVHLGQQQQQQQEPVALLPAPFSVSLSTLALPAEAPQAVATTAETIGGSSAVSSEPWYSGLPDQVCNHSCAKSNTAIVRNNYMMKY